MNRSQLRILLRSVSFLLALAMCWGSRYYLDPDGMSYVDLARAYLRGDWHNALSSYWSPLYAWLLTLTFGLFHPSAEWLIPSTHFVCVGLFVAVLAAWEWLLKEWETSYGPPSHWVLIDTTGYLLVTWAGLDLGGVDFSSADDFVIASLLAVCALLLRIRRAPRTWDYVYLGCVLAFGFFAKAAFQTVIPAVLLVLFLRSGRGSLITAASAVSLLAAFVVPLSISRGKLTISDTGRLNYAWQVTGYGVEGYKEEGHPAPANIPHPIDRLNDSPRVLGFEKHLIGTTPVHFDPVWWCDGYPVYIDWQRQWMVLKDNLPEMFQEFWPSPALWFAVVVFPFGIRRVWKNIVDLWYIWLPAVCMLGAYCLVYVLSRYTCAPFTIIGFVLLAAGWKITLPKWVARGALAFVIGVSCYSLWTELTEGVWSVEQEITGQKRPDDIYVVDIYERMKREGVRPGDLAATIGLSLSVQYLQLLEAQEVAVVPARIYQRDGDIGRPLDFTWEGVDAFWKAEPAARERALDAMRAAGAKWVFASQTPADADVTGWIPICKEKDLREEDTKGVIFYRRLVK